MATPIFDRSARSHIERACVVIDITAMVARAENLPNRIREWRRLRKLTLQQLADRLDTTNGTLSRLETGERVVDLPWLRRIARALDCKPADLLTAEDNPLTALNEEQQFVVQTMVDLGAGATRTLYRVSEGIHDFSHRPITVEDPDRKSA